jgi:hypothetical protein
MIYALVISTLGFLAAVYAVFSVVQLTGRRGSLKDGKYTLHKVGTDANGDDIFEVEETDEKVL